jgi:hypothetical protein
MNQDIKEIRLLYSNPETGTVSIVHPSGEAPLEYVVEHAVPKNCPYWIVSGNELPEDTSFRDAWELDLDILGDPNGTGGANL